MHYTDFCDAPAAKPSAGGNTSDHMLTNWIRCFEDIMGYHSHAWEPKKNRGKKYRGDSGIERAGQDNALEEGDQTGPT